MDHREDEIKIKVENIIDHELNQLIMKWDETKSVTRGDIIGCRNVVLDRLLRLVYIYG